MGTVVSPEQNFTATPPFSHLAAAIAWTPHVCNFLQEYPTSPGWGPPHTVDT